MSRLIDADRLHREIMELAMAKDHVRIAKIINMVEIQPTVDAVPAVHGTWLNKEQTFTHNNMTFSGKYPTCSLCGQFETGLEQKTKFCPGCGAKMDGGETDGP